MFVPISQIGGIHPAFIEFFLLFFRILIVAVRSLCRRTDNDFSYGLVILRHHLVRFRLTVLIDFHNTHFIVNAAAAYCPESFRSSVTVEDIWRQHFQIAHAGRLFKRRSHRYQPSQGRNIKRSLFLHTGQHFQCRGGSGQIGDSVFFNILQSGARSKRAHNYQRSAHIKGRACSAGMASASVKQRSHIHADILAVQRIVHDRVMSGQHFIDIIKRYALWQR